MKNCFRQLLIQGCCLASKSRPSTLPSATTGADSSPPSSALWCFDCWPTGSPKKVSLCKFFLVGLWGTNGSTRTSIRRIWCPALSTNLELFGSNFFYYFVDCRDHHGRFQNQLPGGLSLRPAGAVHLRADWVRLDCLVQLFHFYDVVAPGRIVGRRPSARPFHNAFPTFPMENGPRIYLTKETGRK